MIKPLIKRFVPNYEQTSDTDVRTAYGVLAGSIGLICNFLSVFVKTYYWHNDKQHSHYF